MSAAEIRKSQLASLQEELKEVQYQLQEKNSSVLGFETQVSDAKVSFTSSYCVVSSTFGPLFSSVFFFIEKACGETSSTGNDTTGSNYIKQSGGKASERYEKC